MPSLNTTSSSLAMLHLFYSPTLVESMSRSTSSLGEKLTIP